ncbi:MAG: DUF4091 domain-containing protein [Clostridia bacterium]|nr:DUF4091 domain-containing protein [Oscillospiraceae bacterium]MBQ6701744.1 DUF4091 domain-containing protein [Clostridia bacterium]
MEKFDLKIISGLEKCFIDQSIEEKKQIKRISMLANERLSFQLAFSAETPLYRRCAFKCNLELESPIREYIKLESVEQVPVKMPVYKDQNDDNYLRKEPGLYPDLLLPFVLERENNLIFVQDELRSIFVTVLCKDGIKAGEYPVKFKAVFEGRVLAEAEIVVEVIGKKTEDLSIYHTEWFYTDCLAQYYNVEVWSERHWEIIENYVKEAVDSGVNTLLTPLLTPPLDTLVGGERLTTQLVDVTLTNGKYSFNFDKVGRWIELCDRCGIKFFEINHFFTQWGAEHAPKVMADVDGEYKKIFGWETEAAGKEYTEFLHSFLDALIPYLKEKGVDKRCFYHISDEPRAEHLENYSKARAVVTEKLKGYTIIDALSNYEFYKNGVVDCPVPGSNHIVPFIENKVPGLWVYYCCSQNVEVANRFVSMPGSRIRIIGAQMYKFDIKGFLHWGFNFWNCRYSVKPVNPFLETCGEYFTPAGDCFLVYPAQDGTAYTSLHCRQFGMALEDHKAMMLCESLIGREKTLAAVEEGAEGFTFTQYPMDEEYLLSMRERINGLIKNA